MCSLLAGNCRGVACFTTRLIDVDRRLNLNSRTRSWNVSSSEYLSEVAVRSVLVKRSTITMNLLHVLLVIVSSKVIP